MFGIWKPTDRPIKLQCRLKSEIEHLLPSLIVFLCTFGIVSFLTWKFGLVEFLKFAVFAIVAIVAIIIVCLLIAYALMFLFKNTIGRLWNFTAEKAGLRGLQKTKAELAVANAALTGLLAVILLIFAGVIILGVLNDGLISLIEAVVLMLICVVIIFAGIAVAYILYRVISFLWEQFWVLMGCPTKAEKAALKRKWEAEKDAKERADWEQKRKEFLDRIERDMKKGA